jgi:hypothetical protein
MHYMMIVKSSKGCEAGDRPAEDAMAAIRHYTQELRKAGALVELSRLHPSSKGARVRLSGHTRIVTDGPFAETKELIGGYWVIEAKSLSEAIEWAKRVPAPHGDAESAEIEIRQFLEVEEFVPGETVDRAPGARNELAAAGQQF